MEVAPSPASVALDVRQDWIVDAWVQSIAAAAGETVITDYVAGKDVPKWARKARAEQHVAGRIY